MYHGYPEREVSDGADARDIDEFEQFALVLVIQLPRRVATLAVAVAHRVALNAAENTQKRSDECVTQNQFLAVQLWIKRILKSEPSPSRSHKGTTLLRRWFNIFFRKFERSSCLMGDSNFFMQ